MREMVVAHVESCSCCLRARVLLRTVEGARGVVLPVDYAVAIHLQQGHHHTADGASGLLMDRLLRMCTETGTAVQQVILDTAAETMLMGKMVFERQALAETYFCSPSEALMLAARLRIPLSVTEAVLRGRPGAQQCGLSVGHHAGHREMPH